MALFNQLTLRSILNGRNNLGTPELRAAVASMSEEQKDDALVFLKCNTKELAGLPDGQGMQAIANVRTLLDYLLENIYTIALKLKFFKKQKSIYRPQTQYKALENLSTRF